MSVVTSPATWNGMVRLWPMQGEPADILKAGLD
ncbi:MAG: hypothetical protein JWM99_4705 [Verrucomicrobiales bacterium]|nr:hypothetical protein [Verrucomicrobiales bacterium]